ncbi:diguanylate cyclase domain-containing protein [Aquabacterium humicola]|uniref:diguanylate cyclase domain-containing protein n=1 Tax=Aquabacterium humicola TaxID=3237377 RepID=UPI002542ACA7|nr:diguanylate cyclase [Rubrivivax pictus]
MTPSSAILPAGVPAAGEPPPDGPDAGRAALADALRRLAGVIDNVSDGIVTIDGRGRVESFNKAACAMFGYAAHEVIGRNVSMLMPSPHREAHDRYINDYLRTREPKVIGIGRRLTAVRKDGSVFPIRLSVSVATGPDDPVFVGLLSDLSGEERERAFEHAALHDPLTGLPNRAHFLARLEAACAAAQDGPPFALLFVDLDRFKPINDLHGHGVGDLVLRAVAARLRNAVQRDDAVARFGGDEFVVLLSGVRERDTAARIAARLAAAIGLPLEVGGHALHVGASVGMAIWGADGRLPAALMASADRAMYAAKRSGAAASASADGGLSDLP